jgi:hypothetical protein
MLLIVLNGLDEERLRLVKLIDHWVHHNDKHGVRFGVKNHNKLHRKILASLTPFIIMREIQYTSYVE